MNRLIVACLAWMGCVLSAQGQQVHITLDSGKELLKNVPVRIPLANVEKATPGMTIAVTLPNQANPIVGQVVPPQFQNEKEGKGAPDLLVILPEIQGKMELIADFNRNGATTKDGFRWVDKPGEYIDLVIEKGSDTTPVMRYMNKTYDSSKEGHLHTFKIFHHLFAPGGGRIVTNGGHTNENAADAKKLLYPHHRGLMFAFNRITYGDKQTADIWHCHKGEHVNHLKVLHAVAGPILAEHRVLLDWCGTKSDPFAEEERQMTVYNIPGGTMVDFTTRLKTKGGNIRLDGDPQHAGFQFRAHNDVAEKTAKQTYYLRPDGKGAEDETRNWDSKKKGPVNLPWNVLSFVLDGERYSVEYIDSPTNPGEKRYSERNYGRFGCYFEYDLTPENPLVLNHRIWLQKGEMTQDQAQALQTAFVHPPKVVSVK